MRRSVQLGVFVFPVLALAAFGLGGKNSAKVATGSPSAVAEDAGPGPLPELSWKTPATSPEGRLFDSTEIATLLAILESPRLRSEEFADLRIAAASRLRHAVQGAETPFIQEAVRRIASPDTGAWEDWHSDERRNRAMLLLSLLPRIPGNQLGPLKQADAPLARAFCLVRDAARISPEDLDDPRSYRLGALDSEDPLQAVAEELVPMIRPNPFPEGQELEDYLANGASRVREFWKYAPPDRRRMVDLDGDGVEEMFVACPALWPLDEDYLHDDLRFLALLRRSGGSGPWGVAYFRRLGNYDSIQHIVTADFDGDTRPEIGVWTSNGCGILCERGGETRALLTVLSGENMQGASIDSYRLDFKVSVHKESHESTPIFGSWDEYCGVSGRKVFHGSGVIAFEGLMYQWSRKEFVEIGQVFLPFGD